MKHLTEFAVAAFLVLLFLTLPLSCDDGETEREKELRRDLQRSQAKLEESREQIIREQARKREEVASALRELKDQRLTAKEEAEDLERRADAERNQTRAAEDDFYVAAVVAFSSVLAVLLLLGLLLQERRARKALLSLLQFLTERSRDEKQKW